MESSLVYLSPQGSKSALRAQVSQWGQGAVIDLCILHSAKVDAHQRNIDKSLGPIMNFNSIAPALKLSEAQVEVNKDGHK